MRVLVCGDRNWKDQHLVRVELYALFNEYAVNTRFKEIVTVIDGCARGADSIGYEIAKAEECASHYAIRTMRFPANWNLYGKAAGIIRNRQMLVEGKPDLVLAFHDDIEHSKGTKDMVARAKKAGVPVKVISHCTPSA